MDKEFIGYIKLKICPGAATPAPPVGSSLGSKGLNIMEFCKTFNDLTKGETEKDLPLRVRIYYKKDKSFKIQISGVETSTLILRELGIKSGSKEPGKVFVSELTSAQVLKIAERKIIQTTAMSIDAAKKIVEGTARSMGIKVVNA